MDGIDDLKDGPPWSNLPTPALKKIYSYLNLTDQKSMSLVFRNWCAEQSSPSLWRKEKASEENPVEHANGTCIHFNKSIIVTPTTISTDRRIMEETGDHKCGPPWSDLPTPAVENIYSYLNGGDKKNMSLVCRNWRKVYSWPSVWRKVIFCFPDRESNIEHVVCARRYGKMFRHVTIVFRIPLIRGSLSLPPHENLRQLISFLEAITHHSQLLSISFKNMFFSKVESVDARPSVYQKILNFLKSQKRLQYVEFTDTEFKKTEAAKILNVIFEINSKTLRHLHLRGFVDETFRDDLKKNNVDSDLIFDVLMNLELLEIDYTQIFENIVFSFYECRSRIDARKMKGCLKTIKLSCRGYSSIDYFELTPVVWNYFRNIFPDLRIELTYIYVFCDLLRFSIYIVPRMPIRALFFHLDCDAEQPMKLGSLLRHISSCGINETIEELKLPWSGSSSNISADLIRFTDTSPLLKTIELQLHHPIANLDTLFKSWLEHRPVSLTLVKITIVGVKTLQSKKAYTHLSDSYGPLLLSLGLSLSLVV